MKRTVGFKSVFAALALIASGTLWSAGFLEREIYFSEADIQTQMDKSSTMQKSYGNGIVVVALIEPPRIILGTPEGKATLFARINVSLLGNPAIPVAFEGISGIRYDDNAKAFFLENPVAQSVQSQAIRPESEPMARQAITQLMTNYFRAKPVYILREDGSAQEKAARWLLRSIRIEAGRVAALLSPV
ncbi:DUF1439 domain-containing protein [Dechloromonas sp. HYN0024]|uniref:DUF1439 domain-containing protein n=1 Tax=Dechloromonas sp. HYN0024 TaxID=2231055 RepID=UPI0013C2AB01|nr:DUF1439 domain-containing protein [Dechloromonas sp. HYN0024]